MRDGSVTFDPIQAAADLTRQVSPATLVRNNEPLAKRTTLRVGGPADLYVEPATEADLALTLQFCGIHQLPLFILGRGSNLLVRDRGFRGVVICLCRGFAGVKVEGGKLRCGAGARLKAVAMEAKRHGLAGLEFLEGIPGSVGGGLRMNAGAMGGAMFDIVESVRVMDFAGQAHDRGAGSMQVAYRACSTLKTEIALEAVLRGRTAPTDQIEQRLAEFSKRRWESQPAASSAGCMFKNPPTIPAGKLIDELGLKGTRVGGAMVSMEHGNFLINSGNATARDVLELIERVRSRARADRGIELETEVEIIGE
ncbi:MAG TPA: UDP-N-acetylmuramate dehydrogenase [Verrucomicrobiae bacterium]|nr:UDP-N-acetylmuramate dehydrogenase [Verrucomicrobiae bacterium]